jgi:hypothetical protein
MLWMLQVQEGGGGLDFGQILRNIPHDAAAMVGYILIIAFGVVLWIGSRKKAPEGSAPAAPPDVTPRKGR